MDSDSSEEVLLPFNMETANVQPFDYQDPLLVSPLLKAIMQNDFSTLKSYIDAEKHVNVPDNQGNTPLHGLVLYKKNEKDVFADKELKKAFELLINSSCVRLNARNHLLMTPLLLSITESQDENFILTLIGAGCDINIPNHFKQTSLHIASKRALIRIANRLIKDGTDINAQDVFTYTPLHYAAEENRIEIVCMLLYYAANVTLVNEAGLTPFMMALNNSDAREIARLLFPFYNDFSQLAFDGYDALLLAANTVNPIVADLVEAGVNVNTIAADGKSVIFFAICYPTAEMFNLLWSRFDHLNLLHTRVPFLILFIEECCFAAEEWLVCMNKIFESPVIKYLINDCAYYSMTLKMEKHLFTMLFRALQRREIALEERLHIISLFLSHGTEVVVQDVYTAFNIFGFQEEMELLLHCGNLEIGDSSFKFPLLPFYVAKEKNYTSRYIVKLFKVFLYSDTPVNIQTATYAARFFHMPPEWIYWIVYHSSLSYSERESLFSIFRCIPTIPSLKELCRNQIRKCIKKNTDTRQSYYFHSAVNSLNIPTVMKDIIRLKKPLYVIEF